MIGRSHGVHAEPITFGLKMALWYEEMGRALDRMVRAREVAGVGKVSGAVGTSRTSIPLWNDTSARSSSSSPRPRRRRCTARPPRRVSLVACARCLIDREVLCRAAAPAADRGARGGGYFSEGQKGSSAMPHKRNPISAENLSGLARVVRANSLAAMENVALWHERDISHSSVERIILPDSTILIDYMLARSPSSWTSSLCIPRTWRGTWRSRADCSIPKR